MIVVDASAVVALLTDKGEVGQFVETTTNAEAIAFPSLMPFEAASALRSMCMRGALVESIAQRALRRVAEFSGVVFEFEDVANRVWQLRHNLTAYDASSVALAELIDAPLLTLDKRLASAPGTCCRFVDIPAVG